jgi:tetratricopeptide (TPR) repeat protein
VPWAAQASDLSDLSFDEVEARAKASYRRRELDSSLDALSELVAREPLEPLWRERRAQVLLDLKRFEDSIADFDFAVKLQPPGYVSLGLLTNRALACEGLGRLEEADAGYSTSIQLAGSLGAEQPYVLNSRGNVRASLGRYEDALLDFSASADAFRRARNVNGAAYALSNAALVEVQLGRPNAAAHVAAAARRAPGSVDMRVAQAALQWESGQAEAAETSWDWACSQVYSGPVIDGEAGLGGPLLDSCLLYRDDKWVRSVRRWPPAMADKLQAFLSIR